MTADNANTSSDTKHPAEHTHEMMSAGSLAHMHDAVQQEMAKSGNRLLTTAQPGSTDSALLPMHIDDNHAPPPKGGFFEVVGDMVHGAAHEVYEHPWQIAKDAAIGAAAGAAAVVAGPEIAAVAGVALAVGAVEAHGGFAKVGGELWQGSKNLWHNGEVVANPEGHSAAEQAKAKQGLEEVGAVGAHVAAGMAGGLAGGIGTGAITSAMRSSAKVLPEVVVAGAEGGESGTIAGGTAGASGGVGGATAEVAKETGKIVAATGELAKDSALTEGKISLSTETSSGSTHADVHSGQLTNADGTVHKIYFHGEEGTPEATAARIAKERAGGQLNKMIGFENSYPESQAVEIQVGGKTKTGWIQEAAGKPLEDELRERAMQQFGTTKNLDQDVAKILEKDPALEKQVEQAVVERMVYGDRDIATRNIGVTDGAAPPGASSAQTTVRNFDLGEGFSENSTPEMHSFQQNLSTIGLQNAFSGRPLSEGVRETLRNFVSHYDNPAGLAALRETGLKEAQAEAVINRSRWLADNGHMPTAEAKINDPENLSWYKMLEDHLPGRN